MRVPNFVCRYLCGECGHEAYGYWLGHQAHYEAHRLEKP